MQLRHDIETITGSAFPSFGFGGRNSAGSSSKLRLLVINLASVPGRSAVGQFPNCTKPQTLAEIMDRVDTYKEFYQKEIERRNQLNSDLSIPIGIISILLAGIFFYLTNFDFSNNKILSWCFGFLLLLGVIFLVLSIYFLLSSYLVLNKTAAYDYLAFPNEIEKYFQTFKAYRFANGDSEEDSLRNAEIALNEYYISAYLRTATKNMSINDERSTNLYRSKKMILFTLVFLLLAFVPFLIGHFTEKEKIPKVEISNLVKFNYDSSLIHKSEIKMMTTDENSNTPAPPPPPPPPPPPEDRHVKEGTIPSKPKS